jgi:putative transposase
MPGVTKHWLRVSNKVGDNPMLSLIELNDLFDRLGTPSKGRHLVEKARKESPVRTIQSRNGNVITLYFSEKMDRDFIGTESGSVELPTVIQYEHDHSVLEYYAQPCRLDLELAKEGSKTISRVQHIPDFLAICIDQILIEEWRTESRLQNLAAKYPGRFLFENGSWHYPATEEFLAEMGITYRLRSANELPRQYIQNIDFLSDYLSPSHPPTDKDKVLFLQATFRDKPQLFLDEILPETSAVSEMESSNNSKHEDIETYNFVTSDDVYKAIADGQIAFDWLNDDISNTHGAMVYRDETSMLFHRRIESLKADQDNVRLDTDIEVGAEVEYDGINYQISLIGQNSVVLTGDGRTTELPLDSLLNYYNSGKLVIYSTKQQDSRNEGIQNASPSELEYALERASELDRIKISKMYATKSIRTYQRYRQKMKEAGDSVLDQHMALIPQFKLRGNRLRKIPEEIITSIKNLVKNKFNTATNINKHCAYKMFIDTCAESGLKACSEKTFDLEVDKNTSNRERRGKRFVYQNEPIVWYLKFEEPVHGVRPFQIVHIDHTPLDLLVRTLKNKKGRKVHLTLAMDAESRNVVGFYISFQKPSYISVMMVLRDIVRRYGRMPKMIITDNGKEFLSRQFKGVCKLYGCSVRYRPKAQPRHGAILERLFGTTNTEMIHNLSGNTQLMKYVRTVTKSIRPENFVEWTLPALHCGLEYFFERLYGADIHPAHGEKPVEYFKKRMIETGMRLNRLVRFDRIFLILTCPHPIDSDTRIVNVQRGVKVDYIYYWTDAFKLPGIAGKPVEIRIDPWDPRVVYALVKNVWYQCRSNLMFYLRNITRIELRYYLDELKVKNELCKKDLSPERVAEWLKVLDAKNFDSRLCDEQAETLLVYQQLGMAVVEPSTDTMAQDRMPLALPEKPSKRSTADTTGIPKEYKYELF